MKLKHTQHPPAPAYPTFAEYQVQRDGVRRRLAVGSAVLLAAGVASSCGSATHTTQTRGMVRTPAAGVEQPVTRLPGEVSAPTPPAGVPATAPPVALRGDMAFPAPPEKAPQETVISGTQVTAEQDNTTQLSVLGKIKAPDPVPPPERLLGTPPVLPPPALPK